MAELSLIQILLSCGVVALAGLIRGFTGFGSGMLMAPVFAIMFGPVEAVCTVIMLDAAATVQMMPHTHMNAEWRFISVMGMAAALFMPLGLWGLVSIEPQVLTRAMGVVVLVFVGVMLTGWRFAGQKRYWSSAGVGAVSGVMMASTSLGNPVVMMYLMCSQDSPSITRANITAYFAITLLLMIGLLLFQELLTWGVFVRTMIFTPIFLFFTWFGSRLFIAANEMMYRRIAMGLLFSSGMLGLLLDK